MNILLINGSPKGERSDTMRISKAFLAGMGEEYEVLDTMKVNVKPCLGCFYCWNGKGCVQKDDMEWILEKIVNADFIIWSMPLYCYGMPSNVKVLFDRTMPLITRSQKVGEDGRTYHPASREVRAKMMLVTGSGFPDMDGNFDGLFFQARRLAGKDIPIIACLESPLLNIKEAAPLADKYLETVRRAGAEYKSEGRILDETQKILDAPMLDPDVYRNMASGN